MELSTMLTQSLGITNEQAQGGAGLLFKLAKEKLGGAEFGQIAGAVPGIEGLIKSAPASGGGMGGMLSGLASAVSGADLGSVAKLASGFSSLGLNAEMVSKFIPIVLSFVQSKGGDKAKDLLSGVLK